MQIFKAVLLDQAARWPIAHTAIMEYVKVGMKWKMTHHTIFIAFLCDNFPQNLKFCPDKSNFKGFFTLKKSPLEKK